MVEAEDETGFDRLYSRADQLLYLAKESGRDRVVTEREHAAAASYVGGADRHDGMDIVQEPRAGD
ncbi:MAG: hypothetical protein U5L98_05155 [Halomonas sp.]|uniref:hypothetical protein n=1 Tax=Halomonas sp. TaxID=1486246 RepID=UPI002ACE464A|nr:hypothetical protein [Halomonas sp.]MDZ7852042.1 hypothetical protein [Halomonas sp.]